MTKITFIYTTGERYHAKGVSQWESCEEDGVVVYYQASPSKLKGVVTTVEHIVDTEDLLGIIVKEGNQTTIIKYKNKGKVKVDILPKKKPCGAIVCLDFELSCTGALPPLASFRKAVAALGASPKVNHRAPGNLYAP